MKKKFYHYVCLQKRGTRNEIIDIQTGRTPFKTTKRELIEALQKDNRLVLNIIELE